MFASHLHSNQPLEPGGHPAGPKPCGRGGWEPQVPDPRLGLEVLRSLRCSGRRAPGDPHPDPDSASQRFCRAMGPHCPRRVPGLDARPRPTAPLTDLPPMLRTATAEDRIVDSTSERPSGTSLPTSSADGRSPCDAATCCPDSFTSRSPRDRSELWHRSGSRACSSPPSAVRGPYKDPFVNGQLAGVIRVSVPFRIGD